MAVTLCSHNIAHCEMIPVGVNMVHCKLGGDVDGEITIKFSPALIQQWIYEETGLKCFNFDAAFVELSDEVKKYNDEHGKKLTAKQEQTWNNKLDEVLQDAAVERETWETRDHECNYTLDMGCENVEEVKLYVLK